MATASKAGTTAPPSAPKGRGRRGTRASGDDRERAILETAERLLEERPLAEISVDDLAKGAGISRPTFYFYFPSKDAVVLTIIDRLVADAAEGREEILTTLAENGPRAGLRKSLENLYAAFRSRPGVVRAGGGPAPDQPGSPRPLGERDGELGRRRHRGDRVRARPRRRPRRAPGPRDGDRPGADERARRSTRRSSARPRRSTATASSTSSIDIWLRAIYGTPEPD